MMSAPAVKQVEAEPRQSGARKVLVAEDSPITHDLLKLLLNQRGHEVDIASDGLQALEALRNTEYDVALLDFHLPHMDGLQVAATIKAEAHGRHIPRLIAITADPEGLLASGENCENFDQILPKPLDINQVGNVVEHQADIADRQTQEAPLVTEHQAPAAVVVTPTPSILDGLSHTFLALPDDLDAAHHSSRALQASQGDPLFDAIAIKAPVSADDLAAIWQRKALYALPVIDLTGTLGTKADLDASKLEPHETDQIDRLIQRFRDRRAHLHRDLLLTEDLEDRLLGRIFVSGKPLTATLDPASRTCVSYNVTLATSRATREAASLCTKGLLKPVFVERFHVCSACDSERIHVRNACPKCRSSNLAEEQYLHHFRCGFQGPKSEFLQGLHLVCPKCQRHLTEFGEDYGQSAMMYVCRSCGHSDSKMDIGMVCLDCNAHHEWNGLRSRDAFSYQLTDQGTGFAEYGRSFLGLFQKPLRFEELPRELIVALNDAAKKFNEHKTPFTLVNIFYKNERQITAEHGVRPFAEARDKFLENLRSALGGSKPVVKGPSSYDFALLPDVGPDQAQRDFAGLRQRAASTVRFDLGATMKAFGPLDF